MNERNGLHYALTALIISLLVGALAMLASQPMTPPMINQMSMSMRNSFRATLQRRVWCTGSLQYAL